MRRLAIALGLLAARVASAVDVSVAPVEEQQPGAEVTLAVVVAGDPGTGPWRTTAEIPEPLRVTLGDAPFDLPSSGSSVRLIRVAIPADAPAGRYPALLAVDGPERAEVPVELRVAAVERVEVVGVGPGAARAGDRSPVEFVVVNHGNVPLVADVLLTVQGGRAVALPPPTLQLEPGAERRLSLQIVPAAGSQQVSASLQVRREGHDRALAAGTVAIEVPSARRRVDPWRRLPTSLTLWNVTGNADDTMRTTLQGEVEARGALDPAGKLSIDLQARGPTTDVIRTLDRYDLYRLDVTARTGAWTTTARLGDHFYRLGDLVEPGTRARGAWASARSDRVEVGAFGGFDRFREARPWQVGGFARARPLAALDLGVQGMWTQDASQPTWVMSHDGLVTLKPTDAHRLDVRYEAALGAMSPAAGVRLDGATPTTRYRLGGGWAGRDFPGMMRDQAWADANVAQRVGGWDLQPGVLFRRFGGAETPGGGSTNLASTFRAAGPLAKSLRLSAALEDRRRWGAGGALADDLASAAVDWRRRSVSIGVSLGGQRRQAEGAPAGWDASLGLLGSYDSRTGIGASAGVRLRSNYALGVEQAPMVGGDLALRVARGVHRANLMLTADWFGGEFARTRLGTTFTGQARLPWGHLVQGRVQGTLTITGEAKGLLEALVGYEVPFGLPLQRRTDVGVVEGRVLDDATGAPLAGIPVSIDGVEVLTDEGGVFRALTERDDLTVFRVISEDLDDGRIPVGEHPVRVTLPATPGPGPEATAEIRLAEAAWLQLTVTVEELDLGLAAEAGAPSFREVGPLREAAVVLKSDQGQRLDLRTDRLGRLRVERLAPGRWTIDVGASSLPAGHELAGGAMTVTLTPDEATTLALVVRPKVRRLQMAPPPSGGTLRVEAPTRLDATPPAVVLRPFEVAPIAVAGTYADGSRKDVSRSVAWTSSNPEIVEVSGGDVVAHAVGAAVLTARQGTTTVEVPVEVSDVPVVGLQIEPAALDLSPGATARLEVTGLYTDGAIVDVSPRAEWVTDDPSVATVDKGVVTAVGAGTTKITARLLGVTAFPVTVTVTTPPTIAPATGPEPGPTPEPLPE